MTHRPDKKFTGKKPAFHHLNVSRAKLVKVEPGLFLENFVTETLSFRRSVASLSHIRLRVTQSGGVHDKLPVHISSADWWNTGILLPLA